MASSPLELYEKAYRLHYVENRIPAAVNLYKQLIKVFPDANECGYAVIQLQKIKAQSVVTSFPDDTPATAVEKNMRPAIVVCVLLAVGSLLLSGFLAVSLSKERVQRKEQLSTAMNALGKIARNEHKEALQLLDELKQIDPKAIAPYELSADIYRKQNNYNDAKKEYTTYFQKNPEKKPSIAESIYMSLDKKTEHKPAMNEPPPVNKRRVTTLKKAVVPARKQVSPKKRRTKKPPPPPPTGSSKKNKSIYLVNPDSVSYF